jgi:hypothetical protein
VRSVLKTHCQHTAACGVTQDAKKELKAVEKATYMRRGHVTSMDYHNVLNLALIVSGDFYSAERGGKLHFPTRDECHFYLNVSIVT